MHQRQYEYYCKQPSKRPMSSSMPIQVPPRQIRQNLNQLFGLYDDNNSNQTPKTSLNKTGDIYQARFQRRLSAQTGLGINCQGVADGINPGLMQQQHHQQKQIINNIKKGQHSSTLSSSAGSSASASSSSTSTANNSNNNHHHHHNNHHLHHGQQASMLELDDGNQVISISYTDDHLDDDYLGKFDEEFHQDDYNYYYYDNITNSNNDDGKNINNIHNSNDRRRTSSFDYQIRQQQYQTTNQQNNYQVYNEFDYDEQNNDDHEGDEDDDYDDFLNQEYNESHQNRYLRDKDFEDEPPRAGDDPMKLFESIQALARSLHKNTNLVGSLPPKRLIASPVRSLALA